MSKYKFRVLNTSLVILVSALLAVCLTVSVVYAALSLTKSSTITNQVAQLNYTVGTNTITVTNDVDCVMRVMAKDEDTKGILKTDTTQFTEQYNGWFYYNSIIPATESGTEISVTGVKSTNIAVELMQAQCRADTPSDENSPKKGGGFLVEWGYSPNQEALNLDGFTLDGNSISSNVFGAFVGNNQLSATDTENGVYNLSVDNNKIQVKSPISTDDGKYKKGTFYTVSDETGYIVRVYNNTKRPLVLSFMYSTDDAGGNYSAIFTAIGSALGDKVDTYDNGNYYYFKEPIMPGEYRTLITESLNEQTAIKDITGTVQFSLNLSVVDTVGFSTIINGNESDKGKYTDKYLIWLSKLDASATSSDYITWENTPTGITTPTFLNCYESIFAKTNTDNTEIA